MYDPATDFLALWRNNGTDVSKMEMPGLDYVVAALSRAGIINLSVSATAPVVNQAVTAWLQAAVPSYSAEGVLHLWDPVASAYAPATPALFMYMLQASANQSGVSWWAVEGVPANTVGNNGDLAIRMDEPGGVYGPKINDAWPADPLPGTTNIITSIALDNTFGTDPGLMIFRGDAVWEALAIGTANKIMISNGDAPVWGALSVLMDALFSGDQGSILYRDAGGWAALAPGPLGYILATGGPGANPLWRTPTPEFDSGTVMIFRQSAAPTGWTKDTNHNDFALRVTSGAVGTVVGTPFSTVFAQTAVGNTTITTSTMPKHNHSTDRAQTDSLAGSSSFSALGTNAATTTGDTGGDGPHTHSVNLTLSYCDVIIATKN